MPAARCPSCFAKINLPQELVGREVTCPRCKQVFQVGAAPHGDEPPGCFGLFFGFLFFRNMVAPLIIQLVFWLLLGLCVLQSVAAVVVGVSVVVISRREDEGLVRDYGAGWGVSLVVAGVTYLILGPLILRLVPAARGTTPPVTATVADDEAWMPKAPGTSTNSPTLTRGCIVATPRCGFLPGWGRLHFR
jgi:hypothetical protein